MSLVSRPKFRLAPLFFPIVPHCIGGVLGRGGDGSGGRLRKRLRGHGEHKGRAVRMGGGQGMKESGPGTGQTTSYCFELLLSLQRERNIRKGRNY